ncbi:TPA: Crp/Fnr family transcriptional regulator [Serratia marcescens]
MDYITLHNIENIIPKKLLTSAKLINLNKGEFLLLQNSHPLGVYFLVEGDLQISYYDKNGGNIIFSMQKPLSVIGELEVFCKSCRSQTFSTVQATQSSRIILLPLQELHLYGLNNIGFMHFICQHLSQKLYEASQKTSSIHMTSSQRLHRYLHIQSLIYGTSFKLIKRETLASILGISVRQLTRAVQHLIQTNYISLDKKIITLYHIPDDI